MEGKTGVSLIWDGTDEVTIPDGMGEPRSDQMQGTPWERLIELAGRVCYDGETEVLTKEGWVKFKHLSRGIDVATFNRETQKMEFQTPIEYIRRRHVGKMYRVKSTKVSLMVTPDHELWAQTSDGLWGLHKADSLEGKFFKVRRYASYEAQSVEPIVMKGHKYTQKNANKHAVGKTMVRSVPDVMIDTHQMEDWATFLGYYISEGTLSMNEGTGSAPHVAVYQKKDRVQPIIDAAEGCGLRPRVVHVDKRNDVAQIRVGGSTLARYLNQFGRKSRNKRLPSYVFEWPVRIREILLDALMAGDGTVLASGVRVYNTNSKGLADDVQRLIISLGRPCNINYSKCVTCVMYRVRETAHRDSSVNKHKKQDRMIPFDGEVFCVSVPNRVLVTRRDDKIALCGNCYDSLGVGRNSEDYHKHWQEVGHKSIAEHPFATVEFTMASLDKAVELTTVFLNRPCLWVETRLRGANPSIRVTVNARHVLEWVSASTRGGRGRMAQCAAAGLHLYAAIQPLAPAIFKHQDSEKSLEDAADFLGIEDALLVPPEVDEECWVTMYMVGSRGFSHELVRHGDWTAISQRSTRYVDESESPWVMHPLNHAFQETQGPVMGTATNIHTALGSFVDKLKGAFPEEWEPIRAQEVVQEVQKEIEDYRAFWQGEAHPRMLAQESRILYFSLVTKLQKWLTEKGVDKFTARKQARGAARGFLGNALQTEVIFSFNVAQGKHMLNMRAANAADAEIREVFSGALPLLQESQYGLRFNDLRLEPANDGLGMALAGGGHR